MRETRWIALPHGGEGCRGPFIKAAPLNQASRHQSPRLRIIRDRLVCKCTTSFAIGRIAHHKKEVIFIIGPLLILRPWLANYRAWLCSVRKSDLLIMCPARLLLALTVIRGTADALSSRHAEKSNFPAASKRRWMPFP
jgi:hypothetical protein